MELKPLVGVAGILITAMATELNDQVTGLAGPDIRGGLGISNDSGSWFTSLYVSAEIVGLATSPWLLLTFSLRRFTAFVILLCLVSSVLLPFNPDITALYALRVLQGLSGGSPSPCCSRRRCAC